MGCKQPFLDSGAVRAVDQDRVLQTLVWRRLGLLEVVVVSSVTPVFIFLICPFRLPVVSVYLLKRPF